MEQANKRKNLFKLVPEDKNRKIQFEFLKLMVLTLVITVIIHSIGIRLIIHAVLSTAELGRYAETQLKAAYFWINWLSFALAILSFLIGSLIALHFSHRIAGPLYRIESILKTAILNGKPSDIRIRKDDHLQELVDILNEFIQKKYKE